jgi:pimeloyl-ACP methyl ester carboxylesterase
MQTESVKYGTAETNELTKHEFMIHKANIIVYESGQGAPVLLLHGSPDTHAMWLPLIGHLNQHMRCLAPDLPGFGQSTLPSDFALTLDNMADFLRDLLTALHVAEPVTLVTTDFGGHYGLAFMVKYPHLVRGIAISNTNFFHDYQWHFFAKLYRMPIVGELLVASTSKPTMRKTLKSIAPALPDDYIENSYDSGVGSPSVRKTILRMYRARDAKDFVGWEDKLVTLLKQKPAIVLWGDRDPFITPAYAGRFGDAQVHHFKDYSHWLPLEAPDQYADALLPWLEHI